MPIGASRLSFLAKVATAAVGPVTQLWSDYDATNNGSDVVVYDDTVAGDGNARHRINMFNDTYGVISYDQADDTTNTYWRQITLSDTSVTLGTENSYASAIALSHVTTQIGINAATNKIVQGHMVDDGDGQVDLKYVVFTLSGSSVSASSVKSLDGTGSNWYQHGNMFELDFSNNRFVFEGQEGVSVIDFNTGTDTLSEVDYFDYTTDGTQDFANVACFFTKINSSSWLLVGSDGTNHKTQGYTITGSTISELSGTNTTVVAVSSTAGSMSRAAANGKSNTNASLIYTVGDSTNNKVILYPIKATTSSVSVGSALTFDPTNSTSYGRVDNSVWIDNSTYVGIYGFGDNKTILKPFSYDFSTNAITEYSPSVTETQVNTDSGYIFQARKADRVDAERIIVAWSEAGVDTTGDLTVKVIKAGPTGGASWGDWATTVGSQIVQPTTIPDVQRDLSIFNCGDDDTFYVLGSDSSSSFVDHNIFRFDRSGSTITYNSISNQFTTGFAQAFTRVGTIDLAEYNKAIYFSDANYRVFTQNTSTKAITVSADDTWNTSAQSPLTGQGFVNPDDSTELVIAENDGHLWFLSFNNSTNDLTTSTSTLLTGTTGVAQGQGFIIDEGGTKKFAYGYLDGSNWKVYKVNFDGTSGSTTDLGTGGPTLACFAYKKFEDAASNACVWTFDNNTTNIPVMAIIWNGSSFVQGATTNLTHRSADSASDTINNTRQGGACHWTRENNYFTIQIHLDSNAGIPRQNQTAIVEVDPSTGNVTQIGDWVELSNLAETAGSVRNGFRATSDGAYVIAMAGDAGGGQTNGCPTMTVLSRE